MKARQVFYNYALDENQGRIPYRFCPYCATSLAPRAADGRPWCSTCGFVHFDNPAPGVVVLVVNGERVLLGRRVSRSFAGEKWCLPGGFVESNEDFLTAAIREVYEETGMVVEIRAILSVVSNFLSPQLHTMVVVLLAEAGADSPRPGDDLAEVQWFSIRDSLPEMAFEADRHIIERFAATRLGGVPVDPDSARPGKAAWRD